MEMEDADYGEMAWCITTVVGNLDSTDDVSQYQEQLSGRISSILTLMGAVMQEVRQGPSFKKFAIIDSISASVMGFMEECGKSVTDSAADEVKTMLTSKASSFINTLLNGDV